MILLLNENEQIEIDTISQISFIFQTKPKTWQDRFLKKIGLNEQEHVVFSSQNYMFKQSILLWLTTT